MESADRIAVITADIIDSGNHPVSEWMPALKAFLSGWGSETRDWDVYRGDELQIRMPQSTSMDFTIELKAFLMAQFDLDLRAAIGLGREEFRADKVSQSNGSAYRRSGEVFEVLRKQKSTILISSGHRTADRSLNLLLKMESHIMNQWSRVSAESVWFALSKPEASQQELADALGIRQSAVSQRQTRARLDLVWDLLAYFREVYLISIT